MTRHDTSFVLPRWRCRRARLSSSLSSEVSSAHDAKQRHDPANGDFYATNLDGGPAGSGLGSVSVINPG
jgi:hypothetical protein